MRIATLAGSLRSGSYNHKLLALAEDALLRTGVEIDHLDLRDFPLPAYNGDLETEQGLPEAAWKLKARLAACQGIVIVSPEYNAGVPGHLKNMIDWTSRGPSQPWLGKVAVMMGASDGMWGTQRMMPHLRQSLSLLGAHVIPSQVNVRESAKVWDKDGKLLDEKLPGRVDKVVKEFVDITRKLKQGGDA